MQACRDNNKQVIRMRADAGLFDDLFLQVQRAGHARELTRGVSIRCSVYE